MKKYLCLLILFSTILVATNAQTATEAISLIEVIEVEGMSSSDLFLKINILFVDMFKNADSVIQYSDKDSGIIKGKYVSDIFVDNYSQYMITTTITAETRDGRCRITLSDPYYRHYKSNAFGRRLGGFHSNTDTPVKSENMNKLVLDNWKQFLISFKNSLLSMSNSDW